MLACGHRREQLKAERGEQPPPQRSRSWLGLDLGTCQGLEGPRVTWVTCRRGPELGRPSPALHTSSPGPQTHECPMVSFFKRSQKSGFCLSSPHF